MVKEFNKYEEEEEEDYKLNKLEEENGRASTGISDSKFSSITDIDSKYGFNVGSWS